MHVYLLKAYVCMQILKFIVCCQLLLLTLQIAQLMPLQKKFTGLKTQLELKSYDLSLFQGRAEQNEHHKVLLISLSYVAYILMNNILF